MQNFDKIEQYKRSKYWKFSGRSPSCIRIKVDLKDSIFPRIQCIHVLYFSKIRQHPA